MKSGDKRVVILIMSLAFVLIFLGFASACVCGDGICNNEETCSTCSSDCGVCQSCTITVTNPLAGNYYKDNILLSWISDGICEGVKYDLYYKQGNCDLPNGWIGIQDFVEATSYSWASRLNGQDYCFRVEEDNNQASATTSGLFDIDNNAPIITASDRTCNEGETITLTASATDSLSGVDVSTWKWDLDNNGIYETSGQTISYICESVGSETVSVKVSDNAGNSASKNALITIIPPEPTCNHDIAVRYSYSNSFGTGIAVGYGNDTWIAGNPVNLNEGMYIVKYFIDNKKEVDDNVGVVVKLDGNNLIPSYNVLINAYSSKEISFNASQFCGTHKISLNVTSDGYECDKTDNYASREIYVNCIIIPPTPTCDDENACTTDFYNSVTCVHNPINCNDNNALTTDTCNTQTGCIYTPIINPPTPVCGDGICNNGETCSSCSCDCGSCSSDNNCNDNDNKCKKKDTLAQFCNTDWKCSGWSECSNGAMIRQCVDNNHCDVAYNKPNERNSCNESLLSKVYVKGVNTNYLWIIAETIFLIILLIILINLI